MLFLGPLIVKCLCNNDNSFCVDFTLQDKQMKVS